MNQNNEQLKDTAAAFALGALPELEEQAFRREMMRDCELARYVESLESVGDMLLASAPQIDVPESLGAALMAEARRDQEVSELVASPRGRQAAPAKRGRFAGLLLRPAVAVAAAAVLIVGAFALGTGVGDSNDANAPTVASTQFTPAGDSNVSGKVVPISDGSNGAVIKVDNLNPDIGSDVYELWVGRGEKVTRSSLFTVSADGSGISAIPEDLTDADVLMITREPAGGSDLPTGEVLAQAKI
jgi:anti-sigma-K factor RskA